MDGSWCGLFVNTWIRDALFALILISVAWAVRSSLPSDLWKRSQPLTLRATVDVVVEDHWVLPHTVDDRPLAKPPLINWLSAPLVEAFGFAPWSHRVVPALAAWLTCLFTLQLARLFQASDTVAFSAGVLWVGTWLGLNLCWSVRTRCWSWLERPGCGRSWLGFKVFVGQVGCLGCSRFGIVGQRCCGVAIDRDGRDRPPNGPHSTV